MGEHDCPSGGLAAAIGEMKAEAAGKLQVYGSGAMIRRLREPISSTR